MVSVISDLVRTMTDQTNLKLDIDTTLIVSEKGDGQMSYKGFRGCNPLIGMCVDLRLVIGSRFQQGPGINRTGR